MTKRHRELEQFVRDMRGLINEERARLKVEPDTSGTVNAMPMMDLQAAEFVVSRIESYLKGKHRTLDAAFSSGQRGRPKGSGKKAKKAIESERLLKAGTSIRQTAKEDGSQRSEIRARRKRYAVEIAAAEIVQRLRAKPKPHKTLAEYRRHADPRALAAYRQK